MLKIKIVCVGDLKEKFWVMAEEEYKKRLGVFVDLEIIEIKEENFDKEKTLAKEGEKIKKHLVGKVVVCDINAKEYSSAEFAQLFVGPLCSAGKITFVVGSSYGLCDQIKDMADEKISFSRLTFTHNLFRIMLEEQIYRAFMINSGRTYHK